MIKNTSTELAYKWLTTAFGAVPTLTKSQLLEKAELIKKLAIEEIDEFIEAVKNDDKAEMINACSDLLFVANNLPFLSNIHNSDLEAENKRVFESNMTKFCKTEKEAQLTVLAYETGSHPNKKGQVIKTIYLPTNNVNYPFRVQTLEGKIMKSINFKDV